MRGYAAGTAVRRYRGEAHAANDALLGRVHDGPAAVLAAVAAKPAANEPMRGPARPSVARRQRSTTLGQKKAEEARARARARTRPASSGRTQTEARRSVLNIPGIRARVAGPLSGGAVVSAGNELISLYVDIHFQQQELRRRGLSRARYIQRPGGERFRIWPGGRRGAAATRPLSTAGASRTNRTGARAQLPSPVPSIPGTVRPGVSVPTGDPGRQGGALRTIPGISRGVVSAPAPRTSPGSAPAPRSTTGHLPDVLRVQLPDTESLLMRALSPRPTPARARAQARVVSPLRTTLGTNFSPAPPSTAPQLTASNSPLLGLQPGASLAPESQTDRCRCEKPKRKRSERRCRNPVISRTTRDGIRTTKVRLTCPPSRPK